MERTERLHIASSCGLGALIGSALMLQWVGNPYLTTLGALIGGAIGYIANRPQEVLNAVVETLRDADWGHIRKEFFITLATILLGATMLGGLALSFTTSAYFLPKLYKFASVPNDTPLDNLMGISILLQIVLCAVSLLLLLASTLDNGPTLQFFFGTLILSSPIGFAIAILTIIVIGVIGVAIVAGLPLSLLYLVCRHFFKIMRGVCWFVKTVFIAIHSDRRLMCFTDAATGSVIGYCTGSMIIGCFVGIVIGLANYEIFCKRIFKLVSISE